MNKTTVFAVLIVTAASTLLTACGRAGDPLRPAPGVLVMPEDAKEDKSDVPERPFPLDPLL